MEKKVTILVVDDEKVVRDGCQRVLGSKGYEVITAVNGKEALELLEKSPVDVILLDLKMPVMSGEEMLSKAISQYPDIPVIIITGHGTIDKAVECMKTGAYDFITKPFQIDEFLITIKRAVEKRLLEQKSKVYEEEKRRNLYDLYLEKSRLRTIINCMANGVMVTNRNLEIVLHNPAFMRLLEISGEIKNPVSINDILNNEELITTLKKIQSGSFDKEEFVSQEIKMGNNILRAISAPAIGPDNGIVGTVTVLEDITPFKRLDEMKSDFVNMVAHELRSPLVSIKQQLSVILDGIAGPLQEKQKELLEKGSKKIDSLLELINDLLEIAKIEAGQAVQYHVKVNLEDKIKEIVELMSPRAEKQKIKIEYSFSNLTPLRADPRGIEEVLNNLITNAINYSPEGGKITINAKGMGEYVELSVKDTGIGIQKEELPKIFDKFYRVKHPKTREMMGTGLGLSIVKGIIEAHHGTIDVESEPGKGTTFKILLPLMGHDE